jgi:hypothetical protein
MVDIIVERLEQLDSLVLKYGSHASFEEGVCAMEAVAWLAREEHTDAPQCACPVIAAIVRPYNDALPTDDERTRLIRPLLTKIVGTRKEGTPAERASVLLKRMYMVYDWYMRVRAPAFLRLAGLEKAAASLQACLPVVDDASLRATEEVARAAENVAWSAARNAADNAARSAAKSVAGSAAMSAVENAAKSVAWGVAESAAWSALEPTVKELQSSFADLIARMCEVTE